MDKPGKIAFWTIIAVFCSFALFLYENQPIPSEITGDEKGVYHNRFQNGYDLGGDSHQFQKCINFLERVTPYKNNNMNIRKVPTEVTNRVCGTEGVHYPKFPNFAPLNLWRSTDNEKGIYVEGNSYVQVFERHIFLNQENILVHIVIDKKSCGRWYVVDKNQPDEKIYWEYDLKK